MEFTRKDLEQFTKQGTNQKVVQKQIQNFISDFPHMKIIRDAKVGDGVVRLTDEDQKRLEG